MSEEKPIIEAAINGDIDEIKRQLSLGVSVDYQASDKSTPLHFAVLKQQTDTIRFLIDNNASVNAKNERGLTPLHFAANAGDDLTACILLEAGANPNAKDVGVCIFFFINQIKKFENFCENEFFWTTKLFQNY